jgi:hypothetical protein
MIKGARKPMREKLQKYMVDPETGCHVWTGSTDKDGYGTIRCVDAAHLKAHREAYREYVGDPGYLDVLHKSDNPPCINKDHLFLGTHHDNMADMTRKGRGRTPDTRGMRNGAAKLTVQDIEQINNLLSDKIDRYMIAEAFNIGIDCVGKIYRKERWV